MSGAPDDGSSSSTGPSAEHSKGGDGFARQPAEAPEKGNAPILKQSKFQISSQQPFQAVVDFLRRQLHYEEEQEPLHLYLNSAFSPTPDDPISNLYQCFNADGILVVNYSRTAAWG